MEKEISQLLEQVKQAGRKSFWQCTPKEAREFPTLMKRLFGETSSSIEARELDFESSDGYRVSGRLFIPLSQPAGLIVFFHGGGWVLGSVDDYHPFTATLAERTGCAVLSVDYRLSPEHQYPAPVLDAISALKFATSHLLPLWANEGMPMIVMGDSAGATLATVASRHHQRQPSNPRIALQVLAYPVIHARFDTSSYQLYAEDHLLTARDMRWFWDQYCPDVSIRDLPDVSPIYADLHSAPKTLLLTAELDLLRDEGEDYAKRLKDLGNECQLVRCQGLVHGFLAMINFAPSAKMAFDRIVGHITDSIASSLESKLNVTNI